MSESQIGLTEIASERSAGNRESGNEHVTLITSDGNLWKVYDLYIHKNECVFVCLLVLNRFKNHTFNHREILGNHWVYPREGFCEFS